MTSAVLVATGGCASMRPPWRTRQNVLAARELTRQALGAMQDEHWSEAQRQLAEAVRACPEDEEARRHFAEVLWHEGRLHEAIAQMEQSLELASPVDPSALVRLGQMYLKLDEVAAADQRADQALAFDGQLASAWKLKADIARRSGNAARALQAYQRALSLTPDDAGSRMQVARIYLETRRPLRALGTLSQLEDQQAKLRNPAEYWELYGDALLALDRPDEAAAALAQAMQLRRPSAPLLTALVEAYSRAGQVTQAERTAELARQLLPPDQWPQVSSILAPATRAVPRLASRPR